MSVTAASAGSSSTSRNARPASIPRRAWSATKPSRQRSRYHEPIVDRRLGDELQRRAGRPWVHDYRLLCLDGFVALHALLGIVAGLAFLDVELDPADAAVTLIEHGQIIVHAVGDRNAGAREWSGPIGEQRNIDAVLSPSRRSQARRCGQCQSQNNVRDAHCVLLKSFFPPSTHPFRRLRPCAISNNYC